MRNIFSFQKRMAPRVHISFNRELPPMGEEKNLFNDRCQTPTSRISFQSRNQTKKTQSPWIKIIPLDQKKNHSTVLQRTQLHLLHAFHNIWSF